MQRTAGLNTATVREVGPRDGLQMADAAEVPRAARTAHPNLLVVTRAPSLRGAQNTAAAGVRSIILPISASEAHSRSREDQVAEVARVVEWARIQRRPGVLPTFPACQFCCARAGRGSRRGWGSTAWR